MNTTVLMFVANVCVFLLLVEDVLCFFRCADGVSVLVLGVVRVLSIYLYYTHPIVRAIEASHTRFAKTSLDENFPQLSFCNIYTEDVYSVLCRCACVLGLL